MEDIEIIRPTFKDKLPRDADDVPHQIYHLVDDMNKKDKKGKRVKTFE